MARTALLALLGGMVHDIGKLRAQVPGRTAEDSRFDCRTPDRHPYFKACPSCVSSYRYAHGPMGARILADTLPQFPALQELTAQHHSPDDALPVLRTVAAADRLSAEEREGREEEDTRGEPFLLNPLAAAGERALVEPHALDTRLLLRAATKQRARLAEADERLAEALTTASEFAGSDLDALPDHLLGALYRGAFSVPSAFFSTVPDISLASHCHLAGAFAAALAVDAEAGASNQDNVLLIGGDVSGIQDFIHGTATRRAARALRARSFYVHLISLVAARWLADQLGVFGPSVVSHTGGNFLIIAPTSREERLADLQRDLDVALVRHHGPRLSVNIASTSMGRDDMQQFLAARRRVGKALRHRKRRRFETSAAELRIFEPAQPVPESDACQSCGGASARQLDEDNQPRCSFCASLENLGHRLRNARYLTLRRGGSPQRNAVEWTAVPNTLGFQVNLLERPPSPPFSGAVLALDDSALDDMPAAILAPAARTVPRDEDGTALDFEEIASRSRGRPLLAVAKMDVDDLGLLLESHFADGRWASPSRFASFSTALSLFFEGRTDQIAAEMDQRVYMVFAGGDDLLVVGALDGVLDYVLAVHREFRDWVANNPRIHLSCGIAVGSPQTSLSARIAEAETALAEAKTHAVGGEQKNAISVLGKTLHWPHFKEALELRDALVAAVQVGKGDEDRMARTALQRLQALDAVDQPSGDPLYGPEVWRAYYYLRRANTRGAVPDGTAERVYSLALAPFGARKVVLAARLAELATAQVNREEQDHRGGGE